MSIRLGKILNCTFGFFDNDPTQTMGLTVELRFDGLGSQLFEGLARVRTLMRDANVTDVTKLTGKPIEVQYDAGVVRSWRILTEVL